MEMLFGRHKGREIAEIPRGYLRWLAGNVPIQGELANEVCSVLGISPGPPVKNVEDVVQDINAQM